MSVKKYRCDRYQSLIIAGVCQFTNGEFSTNSPMIQSKIELSQSFISNAVKVVEVDTTEPLETQDITFSDIQRLKKAQLVELADQMGIEYGSDATRPDLLSLIAAEIRRNEE